MEIKNETINAIMAYLSTKPFQEVIGLINTIQQEAQLNSIKIPVDKEKKQAK